MVLYLFKMNHPTLPIIFLHAFFSLLFFSCSNPDEELNLTGQVGPAELSLEKVVIALKANKNPEKMLAEKEALESYRAAKLPRGVEVLIPTDSSVVVESVRNGTLDLGYQFYGCGTQPRSKYSLNPAHPPENDLPHYQSIWLSLKTSPTNPLMN